MLVFLRCYKRDYKIQFLRNKRRSGFNRGRKNSYEEIPFWMSPRKSVFYTGRKTLSPSTF